MARARARGESGSEKAHSLLNHDRVCARTYRPLIATGAVRSVRPSVDCWLRIEHMATIYYVSSHGMEAAQCAALLGCSYPPTQSHMTYSC